MKKNFTLFPVCVLLIFSLSASAQSNTAVSLDGSSSYIVAPVGRDVVPNIRFFTVEFWAYVPTLLSGQRYFVFQGTEFNFPFAIGYDGSTGNITVGEDPNAPVPTIYNTGVAMPVGQWVHIAVVADNGGGNSSILYLNGIQQGAAF